MTAFRAVLTLTALAGLARNGGAQAISLPTGGIAALETRAREDSNDAPAHYELGIAYWSKGKYDRADSALRMAIRVDPRYADAYLALAYLPYARRTQLYMEELRGRVGERWRPVLEESHRFYQRAFMLAPLVSLNVLSVAFPVDESGFRDYTSQESQIYALYFEWLVDIGQGRYRLACDRLRKLARRVFDEPHHADRVPDFVLWYRALAAAHSQQFDSAIADMGALLRRSLKVEGTDSLVRVPLRTNEYRFMLAALEQVAGRADSAVHLYQEVLANDLGFYMAHVNLAAIYDQAGMTDQALVERLRAVDANPDDPSLLVELGMALYNRERVAEAEEPLLHAVALNPRDALPHFLLGLATSELGRPADARTHFTRFLELAPQRMGRLRDEARTQLTKLP